MKRFYLLSLIALMMFATLLAITGCDIKEALLQENHDQHHDYTQGETAMPYSRQTTITPSQALAKMQENQYAIILDVRTAEEFAYTRIPGATLLPDYDIEERAGYVLPDKDALILVYCRSGIRSRNATYLLISMGYTNVYDFGGINSWPYERE